MDARLKLHLYLEPVGDVTYRILVPRPGTKVFFSTNYFHNTWHIISDRSGSQFLSRLMWGLSYQRQANTLVYLSGEFVVPNPFDAEPSEPIILTSSQLTPLNSKHFAHLRHKMKNPGVPHTTVRCLTFGLDAALNYIKEAEQQSNETHFSFWQAMKIYPWWEDYQEADTREVMRRCGSCICYAAPPHILRRQAFITARLKPNSYGMDYHYLAEPWKRNQSANGEIQIFKEYQSMLRDAATARNEIEARQGEVTSLEADNTKVQNHALAVRERRKSARRRQRKHPIRDKST